MNDISERLQRIIDERFNRNKASFARVVEISPTTLASYFDAKKKSKPSSEVLQKIVENTGVDALWLLTGQGNPFDADEATKVNSGANSGDNIGSGVSQRGDKNVLNYNDPKTIEEEERKICDLEKEIAYLKERMADKDKAIVDKDARIAELNNTIARLEKINDFLMQQK